MKTTTHDIAAAAIASAFDMLEAEGLGHEKRQLIEAIKKEVTSRDAAFSATLVTPTGDAGPLAASIKTTLEKRLGRPVELRQEADATLLGGALLLYGDMRIDMSVRGALEQAAEHLERSQNE